MIGFFRRIRKKLADDNQFLKYSRYAVGEILLVVIGILIALWINNLNQKRLNQQKIDSILVKIQQDLLMDLRQGYFLTTRYLINDSIVDRHLEGTLTHEDLKKTKIFEEGGIKSITEWQVDFHLQTNGYSQLMSMLDDLPKRYHNLVKTLNNNHLKKQGLFNNFSEKSRELTYRYQEFLSDNYSWVALDQYNDKISDAQIDYIIHNPKFKNQISLLYTQVKSSVIHYKRYRQSIMETYLNINKLLGNKAQPIPRQIRTTSLANEKDAIKFSGTYVLKSGPEDTKLGKRIEVSRQDKNLHINNRPMPLQFLYTDNLWLMDTAGNEIFRFEYHGDNTLQVVNPNRDQTYWIKVNND